MKTRTVAFALALAFGAASAAEDDEANIERLIHHPVAPPAKASAAGKRHSSKPDPVGALTGHMVRVDTVDHGLYVGTLAAADAQSIVLDIALPQRAVRYTLPRGAVADVHALGGDAP